jgi:hypothetical protein
MSLFSWHLLPVAIAKAAHADSGLSPINRERDATFRAGSEARKEMALAMARQDDSCGIPLRRC